LIFSSACQHALRALIYLALHEDRWPIAGREMCKEENIPQPFLSKILHALTKQKLIVSFKGPGGGYSLSRHPSKITLKAVIDAVDGELDLEQTCVLGLDECRDDAPCALHNFWGAVRAQYKHVVGHSSLLDAANALSKKRALPHKK
jgi:Rrf2 family iron-sulfur cluster assembly transcriptional regulator